MVEPNDPYVIAIVLNWNSYNDTSECVESLQGLSYNNLDIVIVDNGSTDGSGRRLKSEFPEHEYLQTGENLGFGAGNNIGIEYALDQGAEYIWLLNNDVLIFEEDTLSQLIETAEANPNAGIVSPIIREYPDTTGIWFERGVIDWRRAYATHMHSSCDSKNFIKNEYIPNCSSLFRNNVFQEVGLLPEKYFLYFEDAHHSTMVRNEGFELLTDENAEVHHKVNNSTGGAYSPTPSYYKIRNQVLFARSFNSRVSNLFWPLYLVYVIRHTIHRIILGNHASISALLLGFIHGVINYSGKGPYP